MRPDIRYNNIIDSEEARIAQAAADAAPALPSDRIDSRTFYIKQRYEKYTHDDHAVWSDLYDRRWGALESQVSRTFINGLKAIKLGGMRGVMAAGVLCEQLGMAVNVSCKPI